MQLKAKYFSSAACCTHVFLRVIQPQLRILVLVRQLWHHYIGEQELRVSAREIKRGRLRWRDSHSGSGVRFDYGPESVASAHVFNAGQGIA